MIVSMNHPGRIGPKLSLVQSFEIAIWRAGRRKPPGSSYVDVQMKHKRRIRADWPKDPSQIILHKESGGLRRPARQITPKQRNFKNLIPGRRRLDASCGPPADAEFEVASGSAGAFEVALFIWEP
jgi:hypothetical protein